MKRDDSYSHILKYIGIFGGVQGLNILAGVIRNKFTALFLGPSGMGLLSLLTSTSNLLTSTTNLGIPTSGVKMVTNAPKEESLEDAICTVRTFTLLSAVAGLLICILLGPLLSFFAFDWGHHALQVILLSPTIFFTILAGGETAILKGVGRLRALATQASMLAILTLAISVPVYWIFGQNGILAVLFLTAFSQWALNFRYSRQIAPVKLNFSKATLAGGLPMVRMGIAFTLAGMMSTGAEFLVRAFINTQGNLETVGLFNAGITIVIVYAGMVFTVLDSDYYPRLSSITGERRKPEAEEERNLCVNRQLEMNVLLIGPVIAVLMIALPFIIPLLYNHEFMDILPMCQVASIAMLLKAVYLPIEYLPLSRGESKVYLAQESFCVILLVACETGGYMLSPLLTGDDSHPLCGLGCGIVAAYALETLAVTLFSRFYYGYRMSLRAFFYTVSHLLCLTCLLWCIIKDGTSVYSLLTEATLLTVSLLFSGILIRSSLKKKPL